MLFNTSNFDQNHCQRYNFTGLIDARTASSQLERGLAAISQAHSLTEGEVLKISSLIRRIASAGLQHEPMLNATQGKEFAQVSHDDVTHDLIAFQSFSSRYSRQLFGDTPGVLVRCMTQQSHQTRKEASAMVRVRECSSVFVVMKFVGFSQGEIGAKIYTLSHNVITL